MKKIFYLTIICLTLSTVISSCSDRKTYTQRLKAEKELIKNYITRNDIKVLKQFPSDSISFGKKEFVLLPNGIYFRLDKKGEGPDVKAGNKITVKYIEYGLTTNADTTNNWDPQTKPYPSEFHYLDLSESCRAFHDAVGLMKKNGAVAHLIVPSKYGFGDDLNANELTPYGYKMEINFRTETIPETKN